MSSVEGEHPERIADPEELKSQLVQFIALLPKNLRNEPPPRLRRPGTSGFVLGPTPPRAKPEEGIKELKMLGYPQDIEEGGEIARIEFQEMIRRQLDSAVHAFQSNAADKERRGSPERAQAMADKLRRDVLDQSPGTTSSKDYAQDAYRRDYVSGVNVDDPLNCESSWLLDLGHPDKAAFFDPERVLEVERIGYSRLLNRYNTAQELGEIHERSMVDTTGRQMVIVADDYELQMQRMSDLLARWPEEFKAKYNGESIDPTSIRPIVD